MQENYSFWEGMNGMIMSRPENNISQYSVLPGSYPSLVPFFLSLRGSDSNSLFTSTHSNFTYSHHFDKLSICFNHHPLQPELFKQVRAVVICGYRYKYIEDKLTPCSFSSSLLGPMIFLGTGI